MVVLADVNFEKVCVLYNIAALHSQIANSQDLQTDAGLKTAFTSYQVSHLRLSYLVQRHYTTHRLPLVYCTKLG